MRKSCEIRFKGTFVSKDDLFVLAKGEQEYLKRSIPVPRELSDYFFTSRKKTSFPTKFLSLVVTANQKYEIYGTCGAEYVIDKWKVHFSGFDDASILLGRPRSEYDKDYLVIDSPEAKKVFANLVQHQNEINKKKKQLLTSTLAGIPTGTVFEGQAVRNLSFFDDTPAMQKIRIVFENVSQDGTIIAVVSNPDDKRDQAPLVGQINTSFLEKEGDNSDETTFYTDHPIEFTNNRDKATCRDDMKSWQYYTASGFHFWFKIQGKQLVGKGGLNSDPKQLAYEFTLKKN